VNATVNGIRGRYDVIGNGPTIVLLASPLARGKSYRSTATALAPLFRVITVELPGSGRASSVGTGWSSEQYADWVSGFIEELGLKRPITIGHSQSGAIAVILTAKYPEQVGRLILVDATGTGPHSILRTLAGSTLDVFQEIAIVVTRWHHVLGNLIFHSRNFVRQARNGLNADLRSFASSINTPTLVAWGCRDHTLPSRNAVEYARCLPHVCIYLSPKGSHAWLISRADEFVTALIDFLPVSTGPASSSPFDEQLRERF
jgi:pimeloyl-ACP methyl ester carboxylesterase